MILTDLFIVAILAFSAYIGTRRGAVLAAFELVSFLIATAVATLTYQPAGLWLKGFAGITLALGNVAAFILIWMLAEIACALVVRYAVLPRLAARHLQFSRTNQTLGAVFNALKALVVVALGLVVFTGLPISPATKQLVTNSFLARAMLASTGQLQQTIGTGLGHDLGESLNFFTVTAEPESEQTIELGYTTAAVKPDPDDEATMLELVNHERTSRGLNALKPNPAARTVARAHSVDMFARGYFSHRTPEGKSPFDRMRAGGISFDTAGENLALAPTLELAHQGLMNSPGHRANILSPSYRTVGIGIIDGGPYGLMVTQDFTD